MCAFVRTHARTHTHTHTHTHTRVHCSHAEELNLSGTVRHLRESMLNLELLELSRKRREFMHVNLAISVTLRVRLVKGRQDLAERRG